eukprot:10433085-Karenia_brevis.AAC.1
MVSDGLSLPCNTFHGCHCVLKRNRSIDSQLHRRLTNLNSAVTALKHVDSTFLESLVDDVRSALGSGTAPGDVNAMRGLQDNNEPSGSSDGAASAAFPSVVCAGPSPCDAAGVQGSNVDQLGPIPVSYTHLTLPTICSV